MAATKQSSKPKAGDATGRQKAALEAEQAETAARRQEELTMVNAQVAREVEHGVFDAKTGQVLSEDGEGVEAEEITPDHVLDFGVEEVSAGEVVIRVNETLTNVTIGAGTNYNFEEGKKYKVPRNVAAHLEEKGYVWH